MTAKRRDDGDLEVVSLGGKTLTYRTLLLLLVASVTPAGDKVWTALGMSRDNSVPGISRIEKRLQKVEQAVENVHDDVDTLSQKFTMFDVNFTKYRSTHP